MFTLGAASCTTRETTTFPGMLPGFEFRGEELRILQLGAWGVRVVKVSGLERVFRVFVL